MSAIDAYLDDLRRTLPGDPLFRRRVLAEVNVHLRESAAEHGEEEALARFGPAQEVAARFAAEGVASAASWAARLLVLCLGGFVVAAYAAENLLPPAPWPSADAAPALLRWTGVGAVWLFGGAAACALAALIRPRLVLLLAAGGALAAAAVLAAVNEVQRATLYAELDVAGRLSTAEVLVGGLYLVALSAVALGAAGWAVFVRLTASRASRSYGFSR